MKTVYEQLNKLDQQPPHQIIHELLESGIIRWQNNRCYVNEVAQAEMDQAEYTAIATSLLFTATLVGVMLLLIVLNITV